MRQRVGYEGVIVRAFLAAHGAAREDGQLFSLNDVTLSYSQRLKTVRWEGLDVIPMDQLDRFLMAHDLMLFELEDWARNTYGRDGYLDPYAEPKELAA